MKYYFSTDYNQETDIEHFRSSTMRQKARTVGNSYIIDIKGTLEPSCASALEELGIITSYNTIVNELLNIPENVDEVIFTIDSCGGSVKHLKETAQFIKALGEKYNTVTYIYGNCCSAAYYLASACKHIIATDSADIGSIGTICIIDDSENDKIKVFVSNGTDYKVRTKDNQEIFDSYIQDRVDELAREFRQWVQNNRTLTDSDEVYNGKCYNVDKALELGLIDSVLSFVDFNKLIKH